MWTWMENMRKKKTWTCSCDYVDGWLWTVICERVGIDIDDSVNAEDVNMDEKC